MITIYKPLISPEKEDSVEISAEFELENTIHKLWYKIPSKFQEYLVEENTDAFLIGLLFLGLKTGNNIEIKGQISARLFYSVNHYLIPALCLANPKYKRIEVFADKLNEDDLNIANVAGTGLSCGVDSFATYYDHINEKGSFKIEYFTFFNAGSHGSGGEKTRRIFHKRYNKIKKFAEKVGKEVVTVDSNLSEILMMKFQKTNTLRNVSCVLLLQKLFRNYYSASKNRFDYFKLHDYDTQDYDSLILNMLSTESTSFYSAVASLTRLERTAFITHFKDTFSHLDICTSPHNSGDEKNCSKCNKCLRTALTLDLLEKLHLYDKVFDIETYRKNKNNFLGYIIRTRNKNQISKDIYELLKEKKELNYYGVVTATINNQKKKVQQLLRLN